MSGIASGLFRDRSMGGMLCFDQFGGLNPNLKFVI